MENRNTRRTDATREDGISRRQFLARGATFAFAAAVTGSGLTILSGCGSEGGDGGGGADTGDKVFAFRVATIEGVGTPMNDAFIEYIDRLDKCSDGRLQGENFPDGQLGGFIDLIDGNRQGTYEITSGGFDVEGELAPDLSALSLGWVFEDVAHVERVIDKMREEMSERLDEATGVSVPAMGDEGWRTLFSNRPVKNLNDVQGLKIRVPEADIPLGMWNAIGANPTPVPFTELYNALQTGVVDAGEGAVSQIDELSFYEPAPNLTQTKHWYNIKPVRVNSDWLNSLPEDLQECIYEEGQAVFSEAREKVRTDAEARLDGFRESDNVQVFDTPDDISEWKARAAKYEESYFEQYPEAREFIERVRALAEE